MSDDAPALEAKHGDTTRRWDRLVPLEARVGLIFFWLLQLIGSWAWGVVALVAVVVIGAAVRRLGPRSSETAVGRRVTVLVTAACVLVAIVVPFAASGSYRLNQLSVVTFTFVALLGLNLIIGVAGQVALAQVAFMGVGAYATAILTGRFERSIYEGLVLGAILAALTGLLIAIPTLKLMGHYLAIATLGIAIVFGPVMKLDLVSEYTGGVQGLSLFDRRFAPPFEASWLTDERWYYFLGVIAAGLGTIVFLHLTRSPVGRSLQAMRDNGLAAMTMGVDLRREKIFSFVVSAAFGGVAGGLLFLVSNRFVSPDNFTLIQMIELLVAVIIGGLANARGAALGALFLVFIYRDAVSSLSRNVADGSYLGVALIAAVIGLLVAIRYMRVPARVAALEASRRTTGLWAYRVAVAVGVGVVTYLVWTLVGDQLVPIAFGNLLTGTVLIVIVLTVPNGLAALLPPTPLARGIELYERPPAEPPSVQPDPGTGEAYAATRGTRAEAAVER